MTVCSEALRSAERLASLLQEVRGTSARWRWWSDMSTLALFGEEQAYGDARSQHGGRTAPGDLLAPGDLRARGDLLASGEVLHLVRVSLIEDGWEVRTSLPDGGPGSATATLEIVGVGEPGEHDELFAATRVQPSETDDQDDAPLDLRTASILLRDAAVEHDARLVPVEAADLAGPSWRTVAPGARRDVSDSMAVLTTTSDSVVSRIRAGVASAEVQLTAASVGLEAAPVAHAEAVLLRDTAVEGEYPQVAFRLGRPTGRRQGHPSLSTRAVQSESRRIPSLGSDR